MPRVTITGSQEERYNQDAEKALSIKLAKGQRMRLACLDQTADPATGRLMLSPMREYYHRLEAPLITDGIAERTKVTNEKTGAVTEDWKYAWIGNPICLGSQDHLMTQGPDAGNCPVCRAHLEEPRYVGAPTPYFAMNVIVYGTHHGSWELAQPPSASVIAWKFPSSRFDKLSDLAQEVGGDLTMAT